MLNAAEKVRNILQVFERAIGSIINRAIKCIEAEGAQFEHLLRI
jgi:hypothetical protein